jgi:hypothetical protein
MPVSGRVAIIAPPHSTRTTIAPAPPGSSLRDRPARLIAAMQAGLLPGLRAKLLNMRDFRASSGFPSRPKRATIHLVVNG